MRVLFIHSIDLESFYHVKDGAKMVAARVDREPAEAMR
jgi:hypothetical protein